MLIRTFFLTCAAFVAGHLGADEKSTEKPTEPFLASDTIRDVGVLKSGEAIAKTFAVDNPFDGTFVITNVSSSCRCAAATLSKKEVAKGKAIEISVKISPGPPGKFGQSLVLQGHVLDKLAALAISLQGNVRSELELESPGRAWTIREDLPPEESSLDLALRSYWNEKQWDAPEVQISPPSFRATILRDKDCDNRWTVRIVPTKEAFENKIVNLSVRVTQSSVDGTARSTSTNFFVRRAGAFQAIIPQRIHLPNSWNEKHQDSNDQVIHLSAYFNRGFVELPLAEKDVLIEVWSQGCSEGKPLPHSLVSIEHASAKFKFRMRDVYTLLGELRKDGFDESGEKLQDAIGYVVLTHQPTKAIARIELLK